jgi:hypothetical protein
MLKAALYYAKRGLKVFPAYEISSSGKCACGAADCHSPGKHPRTKDGFKSATTDVDQIKAWWKQWPNANIAIATGHRSRLCVLDIDRRNGGLESLKKLEKLYGELPDDLVVSTGGGGLHFYFRYPESLSIKSRSMALGEQFLGIDLKSDGGYVIAPPSNHISGKTYSWEYRKKPSAIPDWLIKLLTADSSITNQVTSDVIVEGQRHTKLTSLAGKYRYLGFSENVITQKLLEDNQKFCRPPMSETEVVGIASSISKYPPDQPINNRQGSIGSLQPIYSYLNEVKPQKINWLWKNFIALGKLTLIVGNPEAGKSFASLYIAAQATTGKPWPNRINSRTPQSVIILTCEDSVRDTVRNRFDDCGGDSSRVILWDGMEDSKGTGHFVDLSRDINGLKALIQQHEDVGLLIIDPLTAYLGCTDTHIDARVRSVLGPLSKIAEEQKIAIVGICHLNKSQQKNILYKPGGSIAFVAAARSVILVCPYPNDGERRLFHLIKSNLVQDKFGLTFRIQDGKVQFDTEEITLTQAELAEAIATKRESPATDKAVEWLTDYFKKADSEVKSKTVEEDAKNAGFSKYAFNRACTILSIKRKKVGNDENGYWVMSMPEEIDEHIDKQSHMRKKVESNEVPKKLLLT